MHRRRFLRAASLGAAALALPRIGRAQDDRDRMPPGFDSPDERGEVWAHIEYDGTRAICPIPRAYRQRNTGGSNGAGLCVIASQKTDGTYQFEDEQYREQLRQVGAMWETAKQRPGGYHPGKLKALMAEVAPSIPYESYEGDDIAWMPAVLAKGIPIGVTYGTGRLYRYQPIAHMVSLVHLDDRLAGVVDNNAPHWVAWMPRREFERRFGMGGFGWAFYLNIPRPGPSPGPAPSPDGGGLAFALASVAAVGLAAFTGLGLGALGAGFYLLSDPEPQPETEAR
jgi:hypothetical protein